MNNAKRFLCMYLFTISFFSYSAQEKGYKIIPFNSEMILRPISIIYNTDKDCFTIAGYAGVEIQRNNKSFNNFYTGASYHILKDDKKVAAFNKEKIIIADIGNKISDITIPIEKKIIDCIALDAAKNTIFIGCSPKYTIYDEDTKSSFVVKRCYKDETFSTYCDSYLELCDEAKASSILLAPKKDILYILDTHGTISLHYVDNLALIKKYDVPPCLGYCELYPSCSDGCLPCKFIINENTIAVYNESCIHIMDLSKSFKDDPVFIELEHSASNEDAPDNTIYSEYSEKKIKNVVFHPDGLLVALVLDGAGAFIKYWDAITKEVIDTTTLFQIRGSNFCFRDDGLELALTSRYDCSCVVGLVSFEVIKRYILPPLWMKLKIIQEKCNVPQDILVHCMNIFTAGCSKRNT